VCLEDSTYLQHAADDLLPDIVLMRSEERRLKKPVGAAGDIILSVYVFSCATHNQYHIPPQSRGMVGGPL